MLYELAARQIVYVIVRHFNLSRSNNEILKFDPGLNLRPACPLILKVSQRV